MGGGVITEQDFKNTFTAGFHVTENYSWGKEKTTEFTQFKFASNILRRLPVVLSHNLMVASDDPLRIELPSGEKAKQVTQLVCP